MTFWLLALSAAADESFSRALVVARPSPWLGPVDIVVTVGGSKAPASHEVKHPTGIPDDRVREVVLRLGSPQCRHFHIEQVLGGTDTGSVLWSGSVVLASILSANAATFGISPGSSVVELGTGLGLVSIVASCLGASVVATDGDQDILPMTRRNLLRNLDGGSGEVNVTRLLWGDVPAARALGTFDLVVGADVVYGSDIVVDDAVREASFAQLLCTMWLLSHSSTTVVLAYRKRKPIEARFFALLTQHFDSERLQIPRARLVGIGVPEASGVEVFIIRPRGLHKRDATGGAQSGSSQEVQPPYCATSYDLANEILRP